MLMKNELELGQILFGNPAGEYCMPEYAISLVMYLLDEIKRIYWNREQNEWDCVEDPKIKGLTYNSYWWGDNDCEEASRPNLKFDFSDIEIRWYKRPGRGMTCNVPMSPDRWALWFDSALITIRKEEVYNEKR